jgi:hypothetical protein
MKHLLVLVMIGGSLLAHSQTTISPTGQIEGIVIDRDGSAISGATVYVLPQDLAVDDITPASVKSDGNGHFDFRGSLPLGSYKLYARKDADCYMDPFDGFYADVKSEAPKVELTENHPSATTTVKLGKKAGVIAGRVIDATTGASVKASVAFLDGEGHGHSTVVDGKFRMLVPSEKEVTLMVRLLGAPSERSQLPVAPVRLEPGQYIYVDLPVSRQ